MSINFIEHPFTWVVQWCGIHDKIIGKTFRSVCQFQRRAYDNSGVCETTVVDPACCPFLLWWWERCPERGLGWLQPCCSSSPPSCLCPPTPLDLVSRSRRWQQQKWLLVWDTWNGTFWWTSAQEWDRTLESSSLPSHLLLMQVTAGQVCVFWGNKTTTKLHKLFLSF